MAAPGGLCTISTVLGRHEESLYLAVIDDYSNVALLNKQELRSAGFNGCELWFVLTVPAAGDNNDRRVVLFNAKGYPLIGHESGSVVVSDVQGIPQQFDKAWTIQLIRPSLYYIRCGDTQDFLKATKPDGILELMVGEAPDRNNGPISCHRWKIASAQASSVRPRYNDPAQPQPANRHGPGGNNGGGDAGSSFGRVGTGRNNNGNRTTQGTPGSHIRGGSFGHRSGGSHGHSQCTKKKSVESASISNVGANSQAHSKESKKNLTGFTKSDEGSSLVVSQTGIPNDTTENRAKQPAAQVSYLTKAKNAEAPLAMFSPASATSCH